jgi:hypothetical protein
MVHMKKMQKKLAACFNLVHSTASIGITLFLEYTSTKFTTTSREQSYEKRNVSLALMYVRIIVPPRTGRV